jgi:MinD-like ATPase involved in chromosome partitioning or flagellar assembly
MITLCWSAKGGSGTTVVAAALALSTPGSALLIDLGGDLPLVFGLPHPDGPGVGDWLASTAPADRLDSLTIDLTPHLRLLPVGRFTERRRWPELARALADLPDNVVIDAGTGVPPPALRDIADRAWIVTRPCYLSLRRAVRQHVSADGVVLVEEPGRALRAPDIETSIGAPIVARILLDPAVARAVDSGLLLARLPRGFCRALEVVA